MRNICLHSYRLAAARNAQPTPSKPKSLFFESYATVSAIMREYSNANFASIRIWKYTVPAPTVGKASLVVGNVIVLIVLCFVGFPDTEDVSQLENIGYRTGFVSIAQIPLLFLLAGKNNIIGFLTGLSYERLNWLHRWAARCLLLTTTIHFGYWLKGWWPYGSFVSTKIRTDPLTQRGVIAWAFLLWIVISSVAPIRRLNYEFFVIQHLISFAVFIGFVYIHTPVEVHVYIWIPVGLFFFDRIIRAAYSLYINMPLFHPTQRREGTMKLWACKADFTPLPHNTTRITLLNPPISWQPGQHVFVSCHSVVPLQSHPFTIASIPEDGKMEFLVKAETGGTSRFFKYAEKSLGLSNSSGSVHLRSVAIEGPYGRIRPPRQFDSVILFAGSTGATFTMPLLRDIVAGWRDTRDPSKDSWLRPRGVATRHVRFVWVVKSRGQLGWFAAQLSQVIFDVERLQAEGIAVDVDMSIYCTCDKEFTEEHESLLSALRGTSKGKTARYGAVEELSVGYDSAMDEKADIQRNDKLQYGVREIEDLEAVKDIEGTNECCCKTDISDEDALGSSSACCCGVAVNSENEITETKSAAQASIRSSSIDVSPIATKMLLNPSISLFAGRPTPRNIIRKSLEQALGESAVVVCGPQGLVDDVRNSVVRLSDERAVHKGTGAQGIYLHCESFSY
jgi:predicted ferric reductase